MRNFFIFWWRVCIRAFKDTLALFPFGKRPIQAIIDLLIVAVAAAILYFVAGASEVIAELNTFVSVLAAFVVVFGLVFLINFVSAPYRMERDMINVNINKDGIIEKLKEGIGANLSIKEIRESEIRVDYSSYPLTFLDKNGNQVSEHTKYSEARILVKNKNKRNLLRSVRVVIDRINKSKTNITLDGNHEEDLLTDFAPEEERYYVVAKTNKSRELNVTRFIIGDSKPTDPTRQRIRVSALSVDSPRDSQWFEIFLGTDSALQIKKLNYLLEEAKSGDR